MISQKTYLYDSSIVKTDETFPIVESAPLYEPNDEKRAARLNDEHVFLV